ncbi:MAG: BREX-4 system phosphatase PglZ [Candidatus Thorarchaeota archaeon]
MKERLSLSELSEVIQREARIETRFPVRFILVSGLDAWRRTVEVLRSQAQATIELSSLCGGEDVFPRMAKLWLALQNTAASSILVLPLSQVLGLIGDKDNTLVQLLEYQNVGRQRIYVPLFEPLVLFEREAARSSRFTDGELPPVWSVRGQGECEVVISPVPLRLRGITCLQGIKAYLKAWENGGHERINLVTEWAEAIQEGTGSYTVYGTAYEVVTRCLQPSQTLRQEWGQPEQWQWLAEQAAEGETLGDLCARLLNIGTFDSQQLLTQWRHWDETHRWLSWLWCKLEGQDESYLGQALRRSRTFDDFEEEAVNAVFDTRGGTDEAKQRVQLLKALGVTAPPTSFWQRFNTLQDPYEKLRVLAGISDREKSLAVAAVQQLVKDGVDSEKWLANVEVCYPALAWYLLGHDFQDPVLNEYFGAYVWSRLRDAPTEGLLRLASQLAEKRNLWKYPTRGKVLERLRAARAELLWLDGFGLEWVGLLRHLLSQEDRDVEILPARVALPSITEFNRGWGAEHQEERDLDDIAHRPGYEFPKALVDEIEAVKKIANTILDATSQSEEVIVTSDHGLTRFWKVGEPIEPPEGAEVSKWGRCAKLLDGGVPNGKRWLLCDNGYAVLAIHGRFRGGTGSSGQVHGGATLEEALVPVMRVTMATKRRRRKVRLQEIDEVVQLDVRRKGELKVATTAPVKRLSLRVGAKTLGGESEDGTAWSIPLHDLTSGKHRGHLWYEGGKLGECEFEVIAGIAEEDLGI